MSSNAVLIVGNGFDKSLGLPTTYSDFIQSKEFEELITNKNVIALFTEQFSAGKDWAGIEADLIRIENYTVSSNINPILTTEEEFVQKIGLREYSSKQLCQKYLDLVDALKSYLERVSDEFPLKFESPAFKMFEHFISSYNFHIFSFNYTNTIFKCLEESERNEVMQLAWKKTRLNYVHGSLIKNDIVFGVNDGSINNINNLYLLKSTAKNHGQSGLKSRLTEIQTIFVFGFSFGETDHDYFKELFQITVKKKKFYIFYYDEDSYLFFSRMLYDITDNLSSIYKNNNEFVFIDSSSIKEEEKKYYTKSKSF